MPYANSRAHIFDVSTETFTTLDSPIPSSEFTWDAIGASNGRIYFGTYPNAYLGEFDPVTKQFEFWPNASPGKKYTVGFSETSEGKIRFKGWGPGDAWHLFDPETREITDEPPAAPTASAVPPPKAETAPPTEPPLPEGDTRILNQIEFNGVRYAITFPTSRFWEIDSDGAFRLRGDPKAPAEMWWITPIDGVLIGLSHFGVVFRYDPASGDFESKQIDNHAPGGNSIMFLEAVGPDCAVGANYSQQNLWKIDPETGAVVDSQSMIARVTGEPMCALGFGGKAYLGIYVSSLIGVYDPRAPFEFGVNPKELIELGGPYSQTRPRDFATDGNHVYMTSDSEYGHLTGAFAVIDPRTDEIDVQYPLIADQNLPSLAFDPLTGRLWGGTDRWGQMRSHPPTQESSLIYCYDPSTRKVVHQIVLWPGSDETTVYGVLPGGIVAAGSGGEVALLESETGEILYQGEVGFPFPSKVRIGMDGAAYGLTGGKLHRWEADSNTWTPVLSAPGVRYFCETSPGVWLFADKTTVFRGRI